MLPKHTVNIGKKGINDNTINEMEFTLKKHGLVRVKLLRYAPNPYGDRHEFFKELEKRLSNGKLVDIRGRTAIFKSKL